MADTSVETAEQVRPFIEVTEVWVPEGDKLVLSKGTYGDLNDFASISERQSFAKGEGLPGKAWAEEKPIVLKKFDGSYFKRTEAAKAAGLTAAVAIPVFAASTLKAVLVTLCSDDDERIGAIEVWAPNDNILTVDEGYYGAAKHFEWVSQHTHFPRGQGLPGGVWAANTPMLFRDLGSGYRFVRSESAGRAGLTNGLGLPVPSPSAPTILTMLSARGTPLARRFEIWDARAAKVGQKSEAVLIDGICAREGSLFNDEVERRISAFKGPVGQVLGTGLPLVEQNKPGLAGYDTVVVLPIHSEHELAHIVAWYC
ncbi:GAF domain-containing protein [Aliiroseovarius sp. PTFE2010]|uniref:GAF domain-containing protein n=1 Tax=Aliiroseovarius sp. PTFE2010 TaxID=3417190 RepID=UPI003CF4D35F